MLGYCNNECYHFNFVNWFVLNFGLISLELRRMSGCIRVQVVGSNPYAAMDFSKALAEGTLRVRLFAFNRANVVRAENLVSESTILCSYSALYCILLVSLNDLYSNS